jgi:hypothetical protein
MRLQHPLPCDRPCSLFTIAGSHVVSESKGYGQSPQVIPALMFAHKKQIMLRHFVCVCVCVCVSLHCHYRTQLFRNVLTFLPKKICCWLTRWRFSLLSGWSQDRIPAGTFRFLIFVRSFSQSFQAELGSRTVIHSCSGDAWFKFRSGHRLSWLSYVRGFPQSLQSYGGIMHWLVPNLPFWIFTNSSFSALHSFGAV